MSIYSSGFGPVFGLGDLRPFSPLAGFFLCYVNTPHFCPRFLPGSANFLSSRLSPARSSVSSGSKKQKILSLPPRRATVRSAGTKKFPFMQKSRYAMHNGFFLYPSPNAFSYSSMRRFSSAQYRASSSDMSSRLLFCSIARPTSSAPARSLLIMW